MPYSTTVMDTVQMGNFRNFVESSEGRVFTARLYRKRPDGFSAVVELAEMPKWMFWHGDLIKVQSEG